QDNLLFIQITEFVRIIFNIILLLNFHQISDDDAQEDIIYLSNFVHLPTIVQIEFGSSFNTYRWKHAQLILQACPNVIDLTMFTVLLISPKFIDNPSLISVFKQIKLIEIILEDVYFPSSFAPKPVARFPSLIHIELQDATSLQQSTTTAKIINLIANDPGSILPASRLRGINLGLYFSSLPLLSLEIFGGYWLMGHYLKPIDIFTALIFFDLIRAPITNYLSIAIERFC
ncbi:unnamed protein product, partial [Rotaria sordida]